MKTKQKMLTKPITAGFASIFYFKSVKDGIMTGHWKRRLPLCSILKGIWKRRFPGDGLRCTISR